LLKPRETVTADLYCQQWDWVLKELLAKWYVLINRKVAIFQNDNTRPHAARLTQEKNKEVELGSFATSSYSPDIAPFDFHLFQSLENFPRNKKFKNIDDVLSLRKILYYNKTWHPYIELWALVIILKAKIFNCWIGQDILRVLTQSKIYWWANLLTPLQY